MRKRKKASRAGRNRTAARRAWSRGAGTMVLGTAMIIVFFICILVFIEIYQIRENQIDTKAAADTIADGTALYALTELDATTDDIRAKADEIAGVINDELGVDVGDAYVSARDIETAQTVTVSVSPSFGFVTNTFGSGYGLSTTSGTRYTYPIYGSDIVPAWALEDPLFVQMLVTAETQLGVGYNFGSNNPQNEEGTVATPHLDCSSFVGYVANSTGDGEYWDVGSRATTASLLSYCETVPAGQEQPGDLIFFHGTYDSGYPSNVSHVGIYCGDGVMIHCGSPRPMRVQYTYCNTAYFTRHFLCYKRLPNYDEYREALENGNAEAEAAP